MLNVWGLTHRAIGVIRGRIWMLTLRLTTACTMASWAWPSLSVYRTILPILRVLVFLIAVSL
jgi:hypothetical protein